MRLAWTIRRHTTAWVVLAGFAIAYLSGLYLFYSNESPGRGNDSFSAAGKSAPHRTGELSGSENLSPRTVESLRSEIAVLRRQMGSMQQRENDLRERLTTLESAFGPNTASLPPQREEARITGSVNAKRRASQPSPAVTVTYSTLPEDGFGDTMIDRSPLPVADVRQPTRTLFGIELAAGATPDAMRKKWARLGARHKALLGGLQARHQDNEGDHNGKTDVKLIAGPFPNAAEAAQLCARLRAAGSPCKETVFAGKTF